MHSRESALLIIYYITECKKPHWHYALSKHNMWQLNMKYYIVIYLIERNEFI